MTKISATLSPTCAVSALILVALAFASPAAAQDDDGPRGLNAEPDAADVALTPLGDLNLRSDPIPPLLLAAQTDPYDQTGLRTCRQLIRAVEELDRVLGPDYDTAEPGSDGRRISPGNLAQRIVGSFIPFRSVIREVTGANEHERDFREAIAAGMMRRAYLKGRGQALDCAYPARPATPQQAVQIRAEREAARQLAAADGDNASREEEGEITFVSEPNVQPVPRRN